MAINTNLDVKHGGTHGFWTHREGVYSFSLIIASFSGLYHLPDSSVYLKCCEISGVLKRL